MLLLIGLVAGALSVSLAPAAGAGELRQFEQRLAYTDSLIRTWCRRQHAPAQLLIDLDRQGLYQLNAADSAAVTGRPVPAGTTLQLGGDLRLVALKVAGSHAATRQVRIDYSARGLASTYGLCVEDAKGRRQRWLLVAGLSGQVSAMADQRELDQVLALLEDTHAMP